MSHRYPGAQPFEVAQRQIYYGRTSDSNNLYRLVKLEPISVLYGKSGTGKSSLLNAALMPRAESDGYFAPLRVRFNAWRADLDSRRPIERTWDVLQPEPGTNSSPDFLDKILTGEASLWYEIKKFQYRKKGRNGILLIFDQFEELFTYPEDQVLEFRRQLAEALFTPVPQRYWDALETRTERLNEILLPDELAIFQQPADVKVLLAIRSDRMHLLHQLNDYFPSILKNCYELTALDERQAAEAIEMPAVLSGDFTCPSFVYEPAALSTILNFLTDGKKQMIEATQLQIICNSIESKVQQHQLTEVQEKHVADLEAVIENYYDEKISAIADAQQQLAARRLIEEGLLFEEEERRLSLYEGQIYRVYDIEEATLRQLVDSHLLRAEPSLQGGYTYELSHDSLVSPVLIAKKKRLESERQAAEAAAQAERERELAVERRKRRQARMVAAVMTVLAAISLLTSFFAVRQSQVAEKALSQFLEEKREKEEEKREKEKMKIEALLSSAEKFATSSDWHLCLVRLETAYAIDSTNVIVRNKIQEAKDSMTVDSIRRTRGIIKNRIQEVKQKLPTDSK
ncbi:MAG: hypothetical protein IPM98_04580 [Lewinellaceae bacterium]|nr:hypothetical protein [Lewinellaceae bacterium]